MVDTPAGLETFKAAASECQSQLQTAASKDEALTLAIGAAENLIKAMKLTQNADEKKALKTQFVSIANVADRIKSSTAWSPTKLDAPLQPVAQQPPIGNEDVGQWAANVVYPAESVTTYGDNASQSGSSRMEFASSWSSKPKPVRESDSLHIARDSPANATSALLLRAGESTSTTRGSTSRDPIEAAQKWDLPRATPSPAPYSQIHRLAEPRSTRKRAKREEIILLKASVVNGFKCPPWDKTPIAAEFAQHGGSGPYADVHALSLSAYQQKFFQEWAHAQYAIPPPSIIPGDRNMLGPVMNTSRTIDLVQDAATDCSVVASLCAGIARADRGHDQILANKLHPFEKSLGRPVISPNGKYIVRLNFNGCWRKVVVDDRLPLSNTHRLLHVIDRRQPALLWPALLEKAYLKVRGGYDFPGSNSCSDLWTLTGWIPEQVHLQETDTVPDQLWNRIYKAFMYGDVLVTLGTGKMSSRQERELGLEGQHSYVVLDMKETDHDRLLLVKNPWVEGRGWRGPRPPVGPFLEASTSTANSNNSLEAYHRDSVPTTTRPHPTTFWIELGQVIRHFESLYLNWNPGLFGYRQDIHFEWKIKDHDGNNRCIVSHPQFSFWSKEAGVVWFLLTRHFRDTIGDAKVESDAFNDGSIRPEAQINSSGEAAMGYTSIYVCTGNGNRLYIKDSYLESSDYVTTPQCLLRWETVANSTYTVIIDQDELPESSYTFSLSAFSNSEMSLEPANQNYSLQKVVTGAWTKQTSGGVTSSARYFENPQYLLEVKQRGPVAILLASADRRNSLHVKLTLGHGERMYRLQSRDVLADSGDHRIGCVFAEMQDLQPGLYTIICSLFEAGQTGDYTLRVDSISDVVLKQIPREGAGLIQMQLSPACFRPDTHKLAAPMVPHRLASYTIVARFQKATTPRSMGLLPVSRSPFRFSVELGRGPERKFIIASERGDYADSVTVRSEKVNIDPALNAGELWLVLDRLSGPGGPVEEWYEVEIYTDLPQACTIGVWRNWE